MKVINKTKNTLYAEDINLHIPYKNGEEDTIEPDLLKRSKALRSLILNDMLTVVSYDENERIENSLMYMKAKSETKEIAKEEEPEPEPAIPSKDIEVKFHGMFYDAGGYSKVNRNLAIRLSELGFKVKVDAKRTINQLREDEIRPFINLEKTELSRNHIRIDSVIPTFSEPCSGKYSVLYTTIESYSVPQQFIDSCEMYNEIWLTSPWAKTILEKYTKKPIYVVPAGVDQKLYTTHGPAFDLNNSVKKFVFVSVFGWGYRKGYDVLIKAYFDEFSADDDVSLLIMSRYQGSTNKVQSDRIRDDIQKLMEFFPNKTLPHLVRFSKVLPEESMPKLYRAANCFVLPSRGEGSCCTEGTKIVTRNGLQCIENVQCGDTVLTHTGNFHKVTHTMHRSIDEPVYEITTKMVPTPIRVTKEHPVFVLKKNKAWSSDRKNYDSFTIKNCEWIPAEQLQVDDFVTFPIESCNNEDMKSVDIEHYFAKNRFSIDNEHVRCLSRNQAGKTFNHPKSKKIPKKIIITDSLLELVGFYIAEGSFSHNNVVWTFHAKETKYHSSIISALKENFDVVPKTYLDKNCAHIRCSHKILGELLSQWCGLGANNKHIPNWAWQLSKRQLMIVLNAIFNGDGCFVKQNTKNNNGYITLTTVSNVLAEECVVALRSIGINPYHTINKNSTNSVSIRGKQMNIFDINTTNFTGAEKRYCVNADGLLFVPIKKIITINYRNTVYNLEVEKDNSYVTSSFSVHNCLPPVEAAMCGLPIIMTNVSGQQMYLRDDNSYMIQMDRISPVETGRFGIHYWDGQSFPELTSESVHLQLRKALRQNYDSYMNDNYAEPKIRNQRMRDLILKNYTWDHTAHEASKRLKAIYEKMKG